eukprot:m.345317 g.345317  ORF g.345317 m.345317 type:complete len:135 (-) comp27895_c0_seq10:199-603(-)
MNSFTDERSGAACHREDEGSPLLPGAAAVHHTTSATGVGLDPESVIVVLVLAPPPALHHNQPLTEMGITWERPVPMKDILHTAVDCSLFSSSRWPSFWRSPHGILCRTWNRQSFTEGVHSRPSLARRDNCLYLV